MNKRKISEFSLVDLTTQSEIEEKQLKFNITKTLIITLIVITLILSAAITYNTMIAFNSLPKATLLKEYKPDQTTLIYDINNKLVANIHGDEDRVIVPLEKISPYLQKAVIAIEDNRFYEHKGIDLTGTLRAGISNFTGSSSMQGGSTLTQQLVKNSFLSPERSIKRKLFEALLAIQVERIFPKKKILEMYLNQIYWGRLCYGAEKASKRYFRKPASNLNLAEASLLAGLIKAPEGYSPYIHYKLAKSRQKAVLERMEYYGYITHDQRIKAEKTPLKLAHFASGYSKYPYFIDYISYLLRKKYGEDIVKRGGFRVYTTLDPTVQEIAEKTMEQGIKALPKGSGIKQGALVSIDVDKGYVQALVGGVDFTKSNFNRAVYSRRAAGSSFKPVVYLTGLRLGKITPESPITDSPISFNTGWNIWSPHNWDGKYMGKMTIRKALTLSRNTPTVRIGLKVGINSIIETARLLGIKSPINRNLSIVLGSTGVAPLEMVTVYSTLARNGAYIEPIAILRIKDNQGNIIEENTPNPIQVVSPNFVKQLDSILIDVVEKGTGKPAKLDDRQVAGKTGTTDNVRDIWFTGFTPDTVTTIWMGNDENKELHGVFSSNCSELWKKFSEQYYKVKNIPPRRFDQGTKIVLKKTNDKSKQKPQDKKKKSDENKKESSIIKPITKPKIVNKPKLVTKPAHNNIKPALPKKTDTHKKQQEVKRPSDAQSYDEEIDRRIRRYLED